MRYILIAIFTALVTGWLSSLLRRSQPVWSDGDAGRISPEKWSVWFTIAGGVLMVVIALAFAIFSWPLNNEDVAAAALLFLLGAAIAGFMLPSLTSLHDVTWDGAGVEGVCKTFGPTLGRLRTRILWEEIKRIGGTTTRYQYIEAQDGRRIYWSYLYKGHGSFEATLFERCPWLATD